MATRLRIATFNLENLDDKQGERLTLDQRIALLRPQLIRIDADVLYLQEVWAQPDAGGELHLSALEELVANTEYDGNERIVGTNSHGKLNRERNVVTLAEFEIP